MNKLLLLIVACLSWTTTAAAQRLSVIIVDGKRGYIDSTGRVVIAPRFVEAAQFSDGLARVCVGSQRYQGHCGFIDTTGTILFESQAWGFSEGLAQVMVDSGKIGYIDRTGRMAITPAFPMARAFAGGFAAVGSGGYANGRMGYIDRTGRMLIPATFQSAGDFADGLAPVATGDSGAFIDTTGTPVITVPLAGLDQDAVVARLKWANDAAFAEGRAAVPLGDRWGFVDRTGKVIIPARFERASRFAEGMAAVRLNGKYGYIDTTGTVRIQPRFGYAYEFSEGLARVEVGRPDRWKSGYIDRTGKVVIAPQFAFATDFSGGLACVVRDWGPGGGGWGPPGCGGSYIDRTGRHVWDAKPTVVSDAVDSAIMFLGGAATAGTSNVAPAPVARRDSTITPPDTTPLPGTGSLVDRVAAVVDRAEAAERGQPVDRADQIMADVTKAATQLAAYLNSHPNDVGALILSVRLGRFRQVAQPLVIQGGGTVPTFASLAAEYAPHHAALNRALALEPNNAEAHFWKARLFGLSHDWMGMLYGVTPPPAAEVSVARAYADSAVRYSRRAVELAPDRLPYREALAIYLILSEQEEEAATVLREVASGSHPMSALLADWTAIPLPAGAVPLAAEARGMARSWMEEGSISDYPFLRVRMYAIALSVDSVQAFYQRHWPGFRLLLVERQEMGDARVRNFGQYIRWRDGQVVAARDTSETQGEPSEGVIISVIEFVNPPSEVRQQFPVPLGRVFWSLSFVNLRRFNAP
jgi:hypothetical protein